MPGLWRYMPILKCKRGEKRALDSLPVGVRSKIRPLIEIVELQGAKTLENHLETNFHDLDRGLPPGTEFFLDAHEVERRSAGASAAVFRVARERGLSFIPVAGLAGSAYDLAAALDHGARGLAVRVGRPELEADRLLSGLESLLAQSGISPSAIDLIMDMGEISRFVLPGATALARSFIREVPRIGDWRTLILAGTAFPKSMRIVEANQNLRVSRLEWLVWRDVLYAERDTLPRLPVFGDCGIQHPAGVEGFNPQVMQASPTIRYTAGSEWLLVKGRGSRAERPGLQFPLLAGQLVPGGQLNAHFAGPGHCRGCEDIARSAAGAPGLGSMEAWRRIGTIHHITVVVEQLAALPVP